MRILQPSATLIWHTPNPAQVIEMAARTCYKSEDLATPELAADFIKRVYHQRGHKTIIEHAVASFRVICDRGVSHEWVRMRIASYCQESTRYCNYGKDKFGGEISVIEPPGLSGRSRLAWIAACEQAERSYLEMLEVGISPQIARSVLPTCLKTEFVVTTNFGAWMNFVGQRTATAAHPQIREIAKQVENNLISICPEVFLKQP